MTFNILNVTVLTRLNWLPPLRDIQIIALVVQINFTKMNHIELTFNSSQEHQLANISITQKTWYAQEIIALLANIDYIVHNVIQLTFQGCYILLKCQMYKTIFNFVHFCPTKIT